MRKKCSGQFLKVIVEFSCIFLHICADMANAFLLLPLLLITTSGFNIESHLDIWCEEPIKTLDLSSINLKNNLNFNKNLIHRCGLWLRHIPNKNWTFELTEQFREIFKPQLNVLKISDGLKAVNKNFFTLESKLRYLDLSENDLDCLDLPELKFELSVVHQNIFHHLYSWDLSKNKFRNISFVKTKIPNLKELDLSQNKLTEVPLSTLSYFLDLEKLILRQNNITKFENSPHYSRIEYLDLTKNHLKNLLGAEKLANLHTLIVSYNEIEIVDTNSFKDVIWGLKELHLDHNKITEVSEDAFRHFPNLKTLNLNNNLIFELKIRTFSVLKKLETLDLSNNFITILNPRLFENQISLIEVNFKNNSLKTLDYEEMSQFSPSLRDINVMENHFECDYFESMLKFLTEKKNINIPGAEVCLGVTNNTSCCLNTSRISSTSFLNSRSEDMKIINDNISNSRLTSHQKYYDISQFFSSLEKKSDALLKLSVYQFAFLVSLALLALVIYVHRNFRTKNLNLEKKQAELEKIISS